MVSFKVAETLHKHSIKPSNFHIKMMENNFLKNELDGF